MSKKYNVPCGNTSCPNHNTQIDMHCAKTCNGVPFTAACPQYKPDAFEEMVMIQDCR